MVGTLMVESSIGLAAGAVVLASWVASLRDRDLQPLAHELGGELIKGALHGVHQGTGFRVRLVKGEGSQAIVSVVCRAAGHLRVTRRRWFDRIVEPLLPHLELSYGDARFRARYVVQTRDLALGRELLSRAEVRAAIHALFVRGACDVHIDGERVKTTTSPAKLGKPVERAHVLSFVEPLAAVGKAVARVAARRLPQAPRRDRRVVTTWIALAAAIVVGLVATVTGLTLFKPVDPLPLLWIGAGLGLTATALSAVVLAAALSRRTSPGRTVLPVLLLAAFGLPVTGFGLLTAGNGLLDRTPASPTCGLVPAGFRLVKLEKRHRTRARVLVPAPGEPAGTDLALELRLPASAHDRLAAGATLWVDLRPGALGVPWLAGYGLDPTPGVHH